MGAVNVPTTQQQFSEKLQVCLDTIGLDSSKYSSHSLRRGGTSFALQCDLSVDLIKIQGDWLVGCFWFNGPLRQYFSLYRAVSQREGEREKKG